MYQATRKILGIIGLILGIWLSVRILLPLSFPFLLGGLLALAAEPMITFLCNRLHWRRGAAVAVGVTSVLCLLSLLLLVLLTLLLRELGLVMGILPDLEQVASGGFSVLSAWLLELVQPLPPGIRSFLSDSIRQLFSGSSELINQGFRFLMGITGILLRQVPDSALVLGTAIISGYMVSGKLPGIRAWIRDKISRERIQRILEAAGRLRRGLTCWLKAQAKLMGITWVILLLGLVVLRVPHAPVWATVVALVDAFPILGTGTVLLPWALVCFLQETPVRGVGLLGVYAVISLTRSVLEPRLVGAQLGLDPLATLASLYAGYRLWGLGGMILAPLLAVAAMQILKGQGS